MIHPGRRLLAPLLATGLPLLAAAQGRPPGLTPCYVTDSGTDSIYRLEDLDRDGTYNGPGEVTTYYDENLGTIGLGNNNGITLATDGTVFVIDSSSDIVLGLVDLDQNGDCHGAGEHFVYFDGNPGGNLSGIEMASAGDVVVGDDGVVWVATANTSSGIDSILRLEDSNLDGDCNDLGEALVYYEPAPGGATGDSIPQDVKIGDDGLIYFVDAGSTGALPKGIFQLDDKDNSGVIDQPNEVVTYFVPASFGSTPFHWGFDQDSQGYWYLPDTGNDVIWRARDEDSNGSIDPVSEASIYWQAPSSSLIWQVELAMDGSLYACESQSPDRLLRMIDGDGNGSIDPMTEVVEIYDEGVSPVNISNPRGLVIDENQDLGPTAYCTAKINSLGCTPAMATVGSPSASDPSPFLLQVGDVLNNKAGILFYGLGPGALPFQGGFLCVQTPIRRTPVQNSGGNPPPNDCSGTLGLDFNAWIQSGVDPMLVPGVTTFTQFWSRDPASPSTTSLSDAIFFVIRT